MELLKLGIGFSYYHFLPYLLQELSAHYIALKFTIYVRTHDSESWNRSLTQEVTRYISLDISNQFRHIVTKDWIKLIKVNLFQLNIFNLKKKTTSMNHLLNI